MGKLKIYSTLNEALEDIQYEGGEDRYRRMEVRANKDNFFLQGDKIGKWLHKILTERGIRHGSLQYTFLGGIFSELVCNAYYAVIQSKEGKNIKSELEGKFVGEVYIGKKGILSGTKQNINFLTREQIQKIRTGIKFGGGIEICMIEGNGIFVNEEEKEIYVSKYFEDSSNQN